MDVRGWLHLELKQQESNAIFALLEPNGPFFSCIKKMQYQRQFAYEILPNKLPQSTQAFFKPSAYHLLPPLYSERMQVYSPDHLIYTTPAHPSRQLSFSQSSLGRRFTGAVAGPSDVKLTFSAYEFFIFNLLHGAIWNTYKPEVAKPLYPMAAFGQQAFGQRPVATPNRPLPPQPKSMVNTIYASLLEDYIGWALPTAGRGMKASKEESVFFFQAAAEVWVGETVPSTSQRVPNEVMHCVREISSAVLQLDMRKCTSTFGPNTETIGAAHTALKDAMYIWLKAAISNWPLDDSFLDVVNLWSMWAAPWGLGSAARSKEDTTTKPIEEGWGMYIIQNFLLYQPLVQSILQRAARYGYADSNPKHNYYVRSVATGYRDSGTVRGEVRILSRVKNVLIYEGVAPLLSEIEKAMSTNPITRSGPRSEFSLEPTSLHQVDRVLLSVLPELRITIGILERPDWSPSPLYSEYTPGAQNTVHGTLLALKHAIDLRYSMLPRKQAAGPSGDWMSKVVNSSQGVPIGRSPVSSEVAERLTLQIDAMQKLAQSLGNIFGVPQAELDNFALAHSSESDVGTGSTPSKKSQAKTLFAQLSQQVRQRGFLSSEGKQEVQAGLRKCSNLDVPALGPRAEHMVRSYELAVLVPIVVFIDRHLNRYYHRFVPETSNVFPSRLTVRPLAAWINLVYLILLVLVLRWLFK
ncbi:hypothetical protein Unana1_02224 [Umbelopsis nana]